MPADAGLRTHRGRAKQWFKFQKIRIVHQPQDDFAHVDRFAVVGGHQAQQLFGVQARGLALSLRCARSPVPTRHPIASRAQRAAVVFTQVLAQARHAGVHLGPAQLLFAGHFAGGGFEQGRPRQKSPRAATHHDHCVRQARHVGPACGARAVLHGEHWQACCRQSGQVAEQAAAQHKAFDLVLHQIGPGAFDQVHKREFVFQGQLLHAQDLFQAPRLNGPGLDARVAGHHHAAHAVDETDARDHAAAGHRLGRVRCVLHEACQRTQRQEGRTGVEQQSDTFTRQQLPAFVEHGFGLG